MAKTDRLDGIDIREARDHERVAFKSAMARGYGSFFRAQEGFLEHETGGWRRMENDVVAFDGDEMVGTSAWDTFSLTVPGTQTDFVAIGGVAVLPTYRRRGIMRGMMERLHRNAYSAGHHLAGLRASESSIYGRFGYGVAIENQIARIDTRDGAFRSVPPPRGEVRFADPELMRKVAPEIWSKTAARIPGRVNRPDQLWNRSFDPRRLRRAAQGDVFRVTYVEDNEYLGYVTYRIEHKDDGLHSCNAVKVRELVAATTAAEIALWRFLLDIDLATEVEYREHSKKSKLLWLLADPRKLMLEPFDSLLIRVLNPAKALASRLYSAPGEVVIELVDEFYPLVGGAYRLQVDAGGRATCERTEASADVSMPVRSMGAIFMGSNYLADLARADRVQEHTEGSIALIDTMFPASGDINWSPEF